MALPSALAAALAPFVRCDAVGGRGRTWRLEREDGRYLLKRISSSRSPAAVGEVLAGLATRAAPLAPALLQVVECEQDGWYGRFEWLDGRSRSPEDGGWATAWDEVLGVLAVLRAMEAPRTGGLPLLTDAWMAQLAAVQLRDAVAELLRRQLFEEPPTSPCGLAHGDFGLQNLVWTAHGVALVDWEELGLAPAEFDGGWLLAMSAVGATPSLQPDELLRRLVREGLDAERLRWFQGLGLLRLLWRARALELPPAQAGALVQRVRGAMGGLLR